MDGLPPDAADLELPAETMRAMLDAVAGRVLAHLASLADQPARGELAGAAERSRALREPPPEEPASLESLLEPLFAEWIPASFTTPGPGYLAYIPGGGLFPAALADLIQATTNRYTGVWQAAPLLCQLEANALDWLRALLGLPEGARGIFTTGGSTANGNAILCAREALLGPALRDGVLYTSSQVHHSVLKAARHVGVLPDRVRVLPVDEAFRLVPAALRRAVREDRARGLRPFLLVSSAGTTNTGAIDPLEELGRLCREEGLWHHVDGAYGACFQLCEELRPALAGLAGADSLTLDPHKGLFLPYGTGALLVRDGACLRAVHGASAGYLPDAAEADLYDPSQLSPDLSRGFPGLRVWLCLKLFGLRRFRAALLEKHTLARAAARRLAALEGFELVGGEPALSLFAFQLGWPGASLAERSAATRELLARVNARGRVMLTGCVVDDGRFLGRVCVLSFRTRRERVEECLAALAEESRALLAQPPRR